jgi:hypothetical protein
MPGGFSGNGSVEWFVDADHPKNVVSKKDPKEGKPDRHHQAGEDHWGDELYEFVVTIKIPKDQRARDLLVTQLNTASQQVERGPGGAFSFTLPVEDKDHGGPTANQIVVDWGPPASMV